MSARSSARELAAAALVLAACHHPVKKRQADPALVTARAKTMAATVPVPAGVPNCKPGDLVGLTMTRRTLDQLAGEKIDDEHTPELRTWVNPPELDASAARVLVDPSAKPVARREAAAELLAAPALLVYRIDLISAPLALGVKDPQIGGIGGRVIRYDRTGHPTCVQLFGIKDDPKIGAELVARAEQYAIVPAEVAKAMRDDLYAQYLKNAPRVTPPAAKPAAH